MTALTLRLETGLARDLDRFCREHGYKKNGLIKTLIRRCLQGEGQKQGGRGASPRGIRSIVGVVRLGGDAAKEETYFD